jgi:hypothetical protein
MEIYRVCKMLSIKHCLYSQLTDCGDVVKLKHLPLYVRDTFAGLLIRIC